MAQLIGLLLVLLGIIFAQLGTVLSYSIILILGAGVTAWLRLTFGAVILVLFFRVSLLDRNSLSKNILILGLSMAGMAFFFSASIRYIPIPVATALQFLGPFFLSVINARKLLDYIASGAALLGVLLLATNAQESENGLYGVMLALCSGVSWLVYIVAVKRESASGQGYPSLAVSMLIASLISSPFILIKFVTPSWSQILLLLFITMLLPLLPYVLELAALKRINVHSFCIMTGLEPCVSIGISFLVLNQRLAVSEILGVVLVVVASLVVTLYSQYRLRS